jgi:uncharacterized lipoprotein YehR (DUF1307 family)
MKTYTKAFFAISMLLMIAACDVDESQRDKNKWQRMREQAIEICYKGNTYLIIYPQSNAAVMSIMLDQNTKVIPCVETK